MDYTGIGNSNEWYTPGTIFKGLGLKFDLDPCSPLGQKIPAHLYCAKHLTEDGLTENWDGLVFMNPPWSGRKNAIIPWLRKFIKHNNGIAIVPARTSCGWFHDFVPQVSSLLFPRGKTKFIPGPGVIDTGPMAGITILACGKVADRALKNSGLGIYMKLEH